MREREVSWWRLVVVILLTTLVPLSIHIFILDVLAIPHPQNEVVPAWAVFFDEVLSVGATLVFFQLTSSWFFQRSAWFRPLALAIIYAMLNEALFRNVIMDIVVSHDVIYCIAENLARPTEYLFVCILITAVAPKLKKRWTIVGAAVVIAGFDVLLIRPAIEFPFERLVASIEYLDTGNIYNPPYGWQVDVPSYLTFIEPVLACLVIAVLVLPRGRHPRRFLFLRFVVIALAMRNAILPICLFSFFQPWTLGASILSESQFTLEALALVLLSGSGWLWVNSYDRVTATNLR